jgi:hypothetical protein
MLKPAYPFIYNLTHYLSEHHSIGHCSKEHYFSCLAFNRPVPYFISNRVRSEPALVRKVFIFGGGLEDGLIHELGVEA